MRDLMNDEDSEEDCESSSAEPNYGINHDYYSSLDASLITNNRRPISDQNSEGHDM